MVMQGDELAGCSYGYESNGDSFNSGLCLACQSASVSVTAPKLDNLSWCFGVAVANTPVMPLVRSPASPAPAQNLSFGK